MSNISEWIFEPWIINQWLETALGFPPWFIVFVIDPIIVFLVVFLLRELCLKILFLFERPSASKGMWRRVSFYLTILIGLLAVGALWRIRMEWVSDSLGPIFGTSLDELQQYLLGMAYSVVTTLIVVFMFHLIQMGYRAAVRELDDWVRIGKGLQFQKALLLSPRRVRQSVVLFMRVGRLLFCLLVLYFYIPLLLSYFPITAPFADTIMPYVTGSAKQFLWAIIAYLPKFFTLVLIVLALRYLLRFIRFAATALENREIQLEGFEPEWADPTYRLVRSLIILVGLMISYPYLPGAGSEIFKGFSIFVGALVTLGASGAINNVISGIVLTYTRAFRVGDRVQIGNRLGDVLEKKLFVTRLRTLENEEITMPNGMLLGGSIVNLSAAKETNGLALHVSAGIGYDVDWRQVHELMKKGARQTAGVLTEPEPFVLETELGNFAVNYTLIAYAEEPKRARHTSAQLRRNILDLFNAEGVEIMTPSVAAVRDGNQPAIPDEYNPKPFPIPGIQVLSHPGKL